MKQPKQMMTSLAKAHDGECPQLPPDQEKAAQEMFERMNKMHDFLNPQITVNGKTEPANRMTLNECRWVIRDQMATGKYRLDSRFTK